MGDNEELSVDQETVDQKVDQPEIGDEPQQQNSTDNFDPKKHTRVQTGANGELCFQGLTQAEVEARIADGQVNAIQDSSNRSVKDIVMGNTLTFFNFINVVLLALVLSVRSYKNMLFIFIIIANTLIGIFQEIKAKITLDKLKILTVSHVDPYFRKNRSKYHCPENLPLLSFFPQPSLHFLLSHLSAELRYPYRKAVSV